MKTICAAASLALVLAASSATATGQPLFVFPGGRPNSISSRAVPGGTDGNIPILFLGDPHKLQHSARAFDEDGLLDRDLLFTRGEPDAHGSNPAGPEHGALFLIPIGAGATPTYPAADTGKGKANLSARDLAELDLADLLAGRSWAGDDDFDAENLFLARDDNEKEGAETVPKQPAPGDGAPGPKHLPFFLVPISALSGVQDGGAPQPPVGQAPPAAGSAAGDSPQHRQRAPGFSSIHPLA